MTTSSPITKPLNLTWVGTGLGVFVGGGISSLGFVLFMLVSTLNATPATEANVSAMWLFGTLFCIGALFPATVVGGLMGAMMGTLYNFRPHRWNGIMATLLGVAIGVFVLGFSYLAVRALVGEGEWATFLEVYWGDRGSILLVGGYAVLVIGGFTLLSHWINRRLP
jgi:hypothetical protein